MTPPGSAENSYRSILRNMSVFGGVQVVQVVAGLLRGKIAAIFLGSAGMGVASLITSAQTTLQQLSSLGLGQSVVRETAAESPVPALVIRVCRLLLLATALCGALLTLVLSAFLSDITFASGAYAGAFALLSLSVFFTTLGNGEIALLQGMRAVRRLALSTMQALLVGLAAIFPFYWFMGDRGIVPAMVVNAFLTWGLYRWSASRETSPDIRRSPCPPFALLLREGRPVMARLLRLGIVLVAAQLLGSLTVYLINIYIRHFGGTADVGLYQAATSLTNQCVAVVFAALGMEFFPRLTTVASSREKICLLVNRQIEVVALVAAPIAALLVLFAPLVVRIILSEEFLPAVPLIRWMGLGILFKAIAYPPGYISFARGDRATFFWLEGVAGNLLLFLLTAVGYLFFGLPGLGIASAATFLLFIPVYIMLTRHLYGFRISSSAVAVSLPPSLLLGVTFAASFLPDVLWSYVAMGSGASLTAAYCVRKLFRLIRGSSGGEADE